MDWLEKISPCLNTIWFGDWRAGTLEPDRYLFDHELVIFRGGTCRVIIEGENFICHDGSWIIVPPGVLHRSYSEKTDVFRYCIHFDWLAVDKSPDLPVFVIPPAKVRGKFIRRGPSFIPQGIMRGHVKDFSRIESLLKTLELRWKTASFKERLTCRALLLEVLIRLFSDAENDRDVSDKSGDLAYEIKSLLDMRPSQNVSIREYLERKTSYSYEHICRIFRKNFGVPPLYYLNAIRVEEAKRLLSFPNISVAEAAEKTGFNDPAYFSRIFKRMAGVSPAKFSRL
ncbi:MAG: hypothetical protein A2017_00210 [Lentisphaerae bacterium GWF2_44_16]|nr:MAG: hypothetical protein A2017_00210 [Lentisphaerae bacterium GWF2_44_16]